MTHKPPEGTSPRYAFMKVFEIPDWENPDQVYLKRWRIFQTPWFALYLHKIMLPDGDRHVHDHPWFFAPLILRGGYTEEWCKDSVMALYLAKLGGAAKGQHRVRKAGRLYRFNRGEYHRIRTLARVPTWTLCFVGPRIGSWGFMTEEGHVDFRDYE